MEPTRQTSQFFAVLCFFSMTSSSAALRVVDLTYDVDRETIFWPGMPAFNFTILNRGLTPAGFWLEINAFQTAEHGGTHVDAPAHFFQGGWRTHQIPASRLAGPAVVIDVTSRVGTNVDFQLSVADLQEWESAFGPIPTNAVVLVNFGWSKRYPNPAMVFNSNNITDPLTFHFPGVHPSAVAWLATQRSAISLGVDTPSTDSAQSQAFETHVALGQHSMLGLENLKNLESLPPRGALVVIGVLKLRDGSGGPGRILALLDQDCASATGSSCTVLMNCRFIILITFLLLFY